MKIQTKPVENVKMLLSIINTSAYLQQYIICVNRYAISLFELIVDGLNWG